MAAEQMRGARADAPLRRSADEASKTVVTLSAICVFSSRICMDFSVGWSAAGVLLNRARKRALNSSHDRTVGGFVRDLSPYKAQRNHRPGGWVEHGERHSIAVRPPAVLKTRTRR